MDNKFFIVSALCCAAAYFIGGVPFGFIIGRIKGHDIRKEGSCNIGATNVTRVVGKWYGKLCFALDLLKGFLPVFLTLYFLKSAGYASLYCEYSAVAVGLFSVGGHMFTPYLKFKGGKGVATAGGVILALAWLPFVIAFATWVIVFLVSRYVSLGSIIASAALPLAALVLKLAGVSDISWATIVFFAFIGAASVWKHKANIIRLKNGTELKFERKGNQV